LNSTAKLEAYISREKTMLSHLSDKNIEPHPINQPVLAMFSILAFNTLLAKSITLCL